MVKERIKAEKKGDLPSCILKLATAWERELILAGIMEDNLIYTSISLFCVLYNRYAIIEKGVYFSGGEKIVCYNLYH